MKLTWNHELLLTIHSHSTQSLYRIHQGNDVESMPPLSRVSRYLALILHHPPVLFESLEFAPSLCLIRTFADASNMKQVYDQCIQEIKMIPGIPENTDISSMCISHRSCLEWIWRYYLRQKSDTNVDWFEKSTILCRSFGEVLVMLKMGGAQFIMKNMVLLNTSRIMIDNYVNCLKNKEDNWNTTQMRDICFGDEAMIEGAMNEINELLGKKRIEVLRCIRCELYGDSVWIERFNQHMCL